MAKPIRVFFSPFSRRFYATRAYRIDDHGLVTVTGEKFDVTNDIANLIEQHNVEFREVSEERATSKESTTAPERAITRESTPGREHAINPASTTAIERAQIVESTIPRERASRSESTIRPERAILDEGTTPHERSNCDGTE